MRSDVKVGLICAVVLLLGFVALFAWKGSGNSERSRDVPGERQKPLTTGDTATQPAGSVGARLTGPDESRSGSASVLGPRSARAQDMPGATQPAEFAPGFTVSTPQTQPVGGLGLSGEPTTRSAATRGAAATAPGGATTGGLTGGMPGGLTGGTPGGLTGGTPGRGADSGLASDRPDMPGFGPGGGVVGGMGGMGGGVATMPGATTEYIVKKGDSIWSIAKAHKVSRAALAAANGIAADAPLKEKQKLKIPAEGTGVSVTTRPATTRAAATRPGNGTSGAATQPATYTVKAGDSLRKIARSVYGDESQWKKIYNANKAAIGPDADNISAGQTLKIPH